MTANLVQICEVLEIMHHFWNVPPDYNSKLGQIWQDFGSKN